MMQTIRSRFLTVICGVSLTLTLVFGSLCVFLVDRIVRPLHDISEAARRLGRGEYDQPLDSTAQDEIGRLAGHMNDTMERMRKYVGAMQKQAYQDELTAIKNVAAYDRKVYDLNQKIAAGQAAFAVVMVDLNQLKDVNDRFGHEKGNIALQRLCQAVCRIYKHSPVYRIGGDEFVVILEGEDYAHRDALFEKVRAFEQHPRPERRPAVDAARRFRRHGRLRQDTRHGLPGRLQPGRHQNVRTEAAPGAAGLRVSVGWLGAKERGLPDHRLGGEKERCTKRTKCDTICRGWNMVVCAVMWSLLSSKVCSIEFVEDGF